MDCHSSAVLAALSSTFDYGRDEIMSGKIEAKLNQMDLNLPTAPEAVGYYVPAIRFGNLVMTSGQLPMGGKEVLFTGKVGSKHGETEGSDAARICALNALAQIK